jgi:hypothetical protein
MTKYILGLVREVLRRGKPIEMPSLKELETWLSTGQVSKKLGMSRQGVIYLAEQRKVRAVKTAAGWLYDPDSVEAYAATVKTSKEG